MEERLPTCEASDSSVCVVLRTVGLAQRMDGGRKAASSDVSDIDANVLFKM